MDNSQHQLLIDSLLISYSPLKNERSIAESNLNSLKASPGYSWTLLQVINTPSSPSSPPPEITLKQSAAIQFRQFIEKHWKDSPDDSTTKNNIRNNLLPSVASAPKIVRVHLESALSSIISADFPQEWPNLPHIILELLNSNDVSKINAALSITIILFKSLSFNYKKSTVVDGIVDGLFPVLVKLIQYLLTLSTPESLVMKLKFCKLFWASTQTHLPPYFTVDTFPLWMDCFLVLLKEPLNLPAAAAGTAGSEYETTFWNIKKWTSKNFDRMFHRYSQKDEREENVVGQLFINNYSLKILEVIMNLLPATGLPNKLKTCCLNYVISSIHPNRTWKALKDHIHVLFQNVLFPSLCFNEEDHILYKNDPIEFIKRQSDEEVIMDDPRAAVLSLISDVIPLRGEQIISEWLHYVLNHVLKKIEMAPQDPTNNSLKEAALLFIGTLICSNQHLTTDSFFGYKLNLESFVVQNVFPEFTSKFGFLRARACWFFGNAANYITFNEGNLMTGGQLILKCIKDTDLPVQVSAAVSLKKLLEFECIRSNLEPLLPELIQVYLTLVVTMMDNEDLIDALQNLVEAFREQTTHLAPNIIKNLSEQFLRLISNPNFTSDVQSVSTGYTYLNTIKTVLGTLQDSLEVIQAVVPYLQPLLMSLNPDLNDYIIDYVHLLAQYTCFVPEIDDSMWPVCAKMIHATSDWAIEFMPEMVIPLDNFIAKSTEKFLKLNSLGLISTIYQKSFLVHDNIKVMTSATQLVSGLFVRCTNNKHPLPDSIYIDIINQTLDKLREFKTPENKMTMLKVLSICLYSNPLLTISYWESKQILRDLFNLWVSLLNDTYMKRLDDIKIFIFGLCGVFKLSPSQIPTSLQVFIKIVFEGLMYLEDKYLEILSTTASSYSKKEIASAKFEDFEQEFKSITGRRTTYGDEEDIDTDVLTGPLTKPIIDKLKEFDALLVDDDLTKDEDLITLFEDQDELIYFVDSLKEFSLKEGGQLYQQLMKSIDEKTANKLQSFVTQSENRKNANNENEEDEGEENIDEEEEEEEDKEEEEEEKMD